MKTQQQLETMTIMSFINETKGNSTYNDDAIQRRLCWGEDNKLGYYISLDKNLNPSNFVIADIETCMYRAKEDGNEDDYEYFKKLFDNGYRFISIDGANRTKFLLELYDIFYNNNDKPVPERVRSIFYKKISICKFEYATKEDLHMIFKFGNSQKSMNKQEHRNNTPGPISALIRSLGVKYQGTLGVIPSVSITARMNDLEHLSYFLMYHQNPLKKITPSDLDKLYKQTEIYNQKEFLNILEIWAICISLIENTKSKLSRTLSFNLFMFLLEMKRQHKCVINKDLIPQFVDKYLELDNLRIQTTIHNEPKTNWSQMKRSVGGNLSYRLKCVYDDFVPFIEDYFYELDDKRLFDEMDKIVVHIQNGFMVEMEDGTFKKVSILQMLNGDIYNGGHKVKPHSKGGKSKRDNLIIQLASINKRQSNRH